MSRRSALLLLAAGLLAAATWLAVGLRDTPDKMLRRSLDALAAAIVAEDPAAVGALVSSRFDGEIVGSRVEFLDVLRRAFAEVEDLEITVEALEARFDDPDAPAALVLYRVAGVVVSAGAVYSRVPFRSFMSEDASRPEPVYTEWVRDGDRFLLRFVTFEVHDRWDDFPASRRAMGR